MYDMWHEVLYVVLHEVLYVVLHEVLYVVLHEVLYVVLHGIVYDMLHDLMFDMLKRLSHPNPLLTRQTFNSRFFFQLCSKTFSFSKEKLLGFLKTNFCQKNLVFCPSKQSKNFPKLETRQLRS